MTASSTDGHPHHLQFLSNFWRPSLSVVAFEGLPNFDSAANVIYKELRMKCCVRLPPSLDAEKAKQVIHDKIMEKKPDTFNAEVELKFTSQGNGFDAPKLPDELYKPFEEATKTVFEGKDPLFVGCGGCIPFMEVFNQNFPGVNYFVTGCGFVDCNEHAANENLDLEYCRKLTTVVSILLSKL